MLTTFIEYLIKFIFFSINTILLVFGIVYLIILAVIKSTWESMTDREDYLFFGRGGYVEEGIAMAVWTALLALLGCVAIIVKYKNLLLVYLALLIVTILLKCAQISAIQMADIKDNDIERGFKSIMMKYKEGQSDVSSAFVNYYFHNYRCCGIHDYMEDFKDVDFKDTEFREQMEDGNATKNFPYNCCRNYQWLAQKQVLRDMEICLRKGGDGLVFTKGCFKSIYGVVEGVRDLATIPLSIGIATEMVLVAITLVLCLMSSL